MKAGDAIASVATPIARALKMGCIDPATNQLRPESGCAGRRNALNNLGDAIFDIFWTKKNGAGQMDYIVSKNQQIAIAADSPDDALKKVMNGEGTPTSTNYSAQPRPQPPTPAAAAAPSRVTLPARRS